MSRTTMLHISVLKPHPANIREAVGDITETAASMISHGILQPLTVVPDPANSRSYLVIAGNRRLAAAKRARVDQIPVIIRRDALTIAQVTEIMLIENLHREDLGPIEKAEAMGRLRKAGYTNKQIAVAVGITDATVSTYLALLELSKDSQDRVARGLLPVGDAVSAVRKVRARERERGGGKAHGAALTWEPDHFTGQHPLARAAARLCDAREHNLRRRIGKVACGQCWETAIRQDERVATGALAGAAPESPRFLEPAANGTHAGVS
jgi:ParB family chromosome partitioning protein